MANVLVSPSGPESVLPKVRTFERNSVARRKQRKWRPALLTLAILAAPAFAQTTPHIERVDPSSGKVNDNVTVMGQNLGKGTVVAVFLSDDENDYKATIATQADDKIVMKVPRVKPGDYNVSFQEGEKVFIAPVHFKVEE